MDNLSRMVATTPLQKQEIITLVSVLICVYIYIYYYILYDNISMFSPETHAGIWKILRHVHTTTRWFSNDFSVIQLDWLLGSLKGGSQPCNHPSARLAKPLKVWKIFLFTRCSKRMMFRATFPFTSPFQGGWFSWFSGLQLDDFQGFSALTAVNNNIKTP